MESFDGIYLDLSKQSGKCRFAENGLGWKPSAGGDTFTLDKSQLTQASWSRAARGYEVKVLTREAVIQLDGFQQEDFDRITRAFKLWYSINLENREHALRGWNWGKAEFSKAELVFNVQSRPAFEIPYSEISNTNLAGKNEVAVEFSLPADGDETGTNGHLGGARAGGKKAGGARDQLVEMRFYVPGTVTNKVKKEDGGEEAENGEEEEEEEEQNAASLFYDTLMDKAEIGEVAGDTFATFLDVLHLTPRGRFDIDLYETSLRLRGKTYDYKIQYEHVKKFMLLPKPDGVHHLVSMGLDPPLRQGQTRYPFLVMQFKRDEECTIDLNMTDEMLENKYNGKLKGHYEAPIVHVLCTIFKGLTGKKVTQPADQYTNHQGEKGIKCSIKANEGNLFLLDRSLMFVPKPATYISYENIASITVARAGGAISATRTFDLTINLKGGGEHQFSSINREEKTSLTDFIKLKGIKLQNELDDDGTAMLQAALAENGLDDSDEDEQIGNTRGSADEDDESVDEDFQADSDSDVAEEFDSDHESSGGSGSEAEMGDDDAGDDDAGDDDDAEEAAKEERPKKKAKTAK